MLPIYKNTVTQQELYNALDYVNHSREKRAYYAQLVLGSPDLFPKVLTILFQVDDPRSHRAAWIAEFVCREDIRVILPHLDAFLPHIQTVHLDAAVRPVAKICEYLILSCYKVQLPLSRKHIKPSHKELIIENCFDWLITNQKVAPQAYALTCLYHLGTEYDWVHDELTMIMEANYEKGTAAYKARCRHMKEAIRKFNKKR